ncbi:MAG: PEP-CTERM sorting domain-containing protein [Opitutaceae bacterium]
MKFSTKSLIAAALGFAFSGLAAHAQLNVNVSEALTFGAFVGGSNNSVTNNGVLNASEVISTGLPTASPFTVKWTPSTGASTVAFSTGTLDVGTFTFHSTIGPTQTFSSVPFVIQYDFDSDGHFDLSQSYTIATSNFMAPNGLTGINYSIVPTQYFGNVSINGHTYGYASVVANSMGTLFDGSSTISALQFQFLPTTPVPEPSTYALFGILALGGIVLVRRRFQSVAFEG